MAAILVNSPRIQIVDENGLPLVGARLYTVLTATSTPVATYSTADLDVAHTNPVVSDANGFFPAIYVNPELGALKFRFFSYDPDTLTETNLGIDTDPAFSPPATLTQDELGEILNPTTDAEDGLGYTPTSYIYDTTDYTHPERFGAIGDGVTDDRLAIQKALDVAAQVGGRVLLLERPYLIRRVAGADSQFNGLHVPFTNVFGYDDHVELIGKGRASRLLAGDNSMTVIRWSDSLGAMRNFAIDGNGKTAVTGLSLMGSDTADTSLSEHVDWNVISRVDIRGCAEGLELEAPSGGGCYFNRFEYMVLYTNTRHIRLRDNATIGGANRNTFIGINMQGGTAGVYNDGADTSAFIHCSFDGITTAFQQTLVGSLHGLASADTQLIGCTWEACTTDLISPQRKMSILGGNCGATGAITAVNGIDVLIGGDHTHWVREFLVGGVSADSMLLKTRLAAFSASNPQVGTTADAAGSFPFEQDGNLLFQARQSANMGISMRAGATSAVGIDIRGDGSVVTAPAGAIATTANAGFLYVATCPGVPTGTPAAYGGAAMVIDTTNHRLYFYSGSSWRNAGP